MNEVDISVCVPVYNEECNLTSFCEITIPIVEQITDSYEMIFVDDGSKDETWQVLANLVERYAKVKGIKFSRNFGKEAALRTALEEAQGKCVITMDADLQHPPHLIPKMVSLWNKPDGADVVEAVKEDRGKEALWYKLCSKLFYRIFSSLTALELKGSSDFKLLDRQVVNAILSMNERVMFYRGMTKWVGFKQAQVMFNVIPREKGVSGWSIFRLAKMFVFSIVSFTAAPLQFVSICGFFCFLAAVVLCIQTVINFIAGHALEGFTTVIIAQLGVGGMLLMGMGALGLYLTTIYEEIKARPISIVADRFPKVKLVKNRELISDKVENV